MSEGCIVVRLEVGLLAVNYIKEETKQTRLDKIKHNYTVIEAPSIRYRKTHYPLHQMAKKIYCFLSVKILLATSISQLRILFYSSSIKVFPQSDMLLNPFPTNCVKFSY